MIDPNAPEVKAAVAKRDAGETPRKRLAEEQSRQCFAQKQEELLVAAEKAGENRALPAIHDPIKLKRVIVAQPATAIGAQTMVNVINAR